MLPKWFGICQECGAIGVPLEKGRMALHYLFQDYSPTCEGSFQAPEVVFDNFGNVNERKTISKITRMALEHKEKW